MIPTLPQGMNRFFEYRDSLVLLLFFFSPAIFFPTQNLLLCQIFFFSLLKSSSSVAIGLGFQMASLHSLS